MASGCDPITHVYRMYIHASPEAVWEAIVNPDLTERYGYRVRCAYDLCPGAPSSGFPSEDMRRLGVPNAVMDGVVLEVDPPQAVCPHLADAGQPRAGVGGVHPGRLGHRRRAGSA